jgi:nitrate/nitrite transport system ATP-binding protein
MNMETMSNAAGNKMREIDQKYIEINQVEMRFDTRKGSFHALREINLNVAKEFVTLIGHSGCGKSTLLNLIAGLTKASSGTLLCAHREIAGPHRSAAWCFRIIRCCRG